MISSSQRPLPDNTQHSQQTNIHAPGGIRTHDLSRRAAADLRLRLRLLGARTDATQQSGQTPDKEVKIKNITVDVSGYTETDTTGMLSAPTVWRFSVAADINSNVFYFYFLIWSLSRLLCCVCSGSIVAAALGRAATGTGASCQLGCPISQWALSRLPTRAGK